MPYQKKAAVKCKKTNFHNKHNIRREVAGNILYFRTDQKLENLSCIN